MGTYSIISVSFFCSDNENVAKAAKKHLDLLSQHKSGDVNEARDFLAELSLRRGENFGLKGGISQWGAVGKPVELQKFVHALDDFWRELLSGKLDGGPSYEDKVVILYQLEHDPHACCFEVGFSVEAQRVLDDFLTLHQRLPDGSHPGEALPPLEYKFFELPFTWWPRY